MKKIRKKILIIFLMIFTITLWSQSCFAKRIIIPVTGKVNSFGTYSFVGNLDFDITKPGEQQIGKIIVEGTYNGEYPWIMRIYTDNTNYTGISGTGGRQNPAGLISTDGRFTVPLLINAPNIGIAQYRAIPDINQPDYKTYQPGKLKDDSYDYTDCIIMGIDPRNEIWVSGENGILFDNDDNVLGDTTTKTPFELNFKSIFNENAVAADYTANLYIEIVPCP